jgi:thiamine monophosphate kinase
MNQSAVSRVEELGRGAAVGIAAFEVFFVGGDLRSAMKVLREVEGNLRAARAIMREWGDSGCIDEESAGDGERRR